MLRRKWQIDTLVMLSALTSSAWSQTTHYTVPAASVEVEFSSSHQALSRAADMALANVVPEPVRSSQTGEGATSTTAPPDTEVLREFATQYWNGNEEAVRRAVARVEQLRPVLTPILHEEGIPVEVSALVLVESAGNVAALSPKGARGIWQLMPDTARRYGLEVTADRDERIEVVKSTRAAARYLRDLYQRFGDWRLTFAAYNAGEQAIERAVARTGHGDFSRTDRALPEETRKYVPAVMNAMELLRGNQEMSSPAVRFGRSRVLYASMENAE